MTTLQAAKKFHGGDFLKEDHEETLHQARRLQAALLNLQYEGKASFGKNLKQIKNIVKYFEGEFKDHMEEEEEVIFPFLASHVPKLEALINLLVSEHADFKSSLRQFRVWLDKIEETGAEERSKLIVTLKTAGTYLIYLLQGHHFEESQILYRVADHDLRQNEKRELIKHLEKCRSYD